MFEEAHALWDESALLSKAPLSRLHKFVHFWVLVWKSFTRNRCPVRASALAYASLLALIPMLAVVMSITSTFLKKEGEDQIDQFIVKMVASLTPPSVVNATNATALETNSVATESNETAVASSPSAVTEGTNGRPPAVEGATPGVAPESGEPGADVLSPLGNERAIKARKAVARNIRQFIQNTRSGTLGVTGAVLLIFAAISMLSRIEDTLNDIWGVTRGRSWFMRIVLYWGVISLVPILLAVALGLASGPHLEGPKRLVETMPLIGYLVFKLLPLLVLCLTFALFYMLMPNTKVRWWAALGGGMVAGLLFHLNNLVSVLYVSRVVSNFKIYGSIGLVPVFMVGLYFSWLILLFGAQVAYAFQNRSTYIEEKQVESINQRGREFVALRLVTSIGQRFLQGQPPPTVVELGTELRIPTRLIQKIMHTLCAARLVVETAGGDAAYLPARPLECITCHDVLMAMRAAHGQELTTGDGLGHQEVYGEFNRIQEAERKAGQSVTVLALAHRAMPKQLSTST
jgi:membrane protein